MILQASLVGGWEKLELWDHTHLALFALLILVCILEVMFLKVTTSARLFTRPHHYDAEYEDSGEYEEDIYYEELASHYNQWTSRQANESLIMQHSYNNYNHSRDEENHLNNNNSHQLASIDIFRYVY